MVGFFQRVIYWSFYLLFILVPIIFVGNTSELFEFNKMWVTFALTLLIGAAWIAKMFLTGRVKIKRTILDIPILLFLLSQLVATIFSMDIHTSLWGYYSRFNGGLYSLLSYAFLYFAFVNNVEKKDVMRYVYVSIGAAVFVALWGLPSHFGYDPTCLIFRGNLDVSCWTFAFQPKVRIFSTLGQPDWLAAYLLFTLTVSTGLTLAFWVLKRKVIASIFLLTSILFYVDLLYTRARSGFIGFAVSVGLLLLMYILYEWRSFAKQKLIKAVKQNGFFLITLLVLLLFTFLIGAPLSPLDKFSLSNVQTLLTEQKTVQKALQNKQTALPTPATGIPVEELGGTDSGKIRLFVWEGALQIFLHYPLFGTGVETFGYSYYQFRPAGHNLTSEWDYLYNKAHNEFLNYLATTGIFGFGTYLVLIGFSMWVMAAWLWKNRKNTELEKNSSSLLSSPYTLRYVMLALLTGYISILVTDFFGFSVVMMNVFLFLTPAFALLLISSTQQEKFLVIGKGTETTKSNEIAWVGVGTTWILCCYFLIVLFRFWLADVSYALGQNLDRANEYQAAYAYLHDAVATRPSEPTFQDELAVNDAVLAVALFQQKDSTNGAKLRDEAIAYSDKITTEHPNVVTYWKSRVRVFYTLSQLDPLYLNQALSAIEKASHLAPTDAKVWYNFGLLYAQTGHTDNAIATEKQTIILKGDYRDAYYALALFYRQKAVGTDATAKTVTDRQSEQNAVETMHFILTNFGPDKQITDTLAAWGEK